MKDGASVTVLESKSEQRSGLGAKCISMKKYQLHTKTVDILSRFPALGKHLERSTKERSATGEARILCLGADLEKAGACLVVQIGLSTPFHLGTPCRWPTFWSVVSLEWSVLAAWVHPGPRTSDYLIGRRAPPRHAAIRGRGAVGATLLLA